MVFIDTFESLNNSSHPEKADKLRNYRIKRALNAILLKMLTAIKFSTFKYVNQQQSSS